MVPAAAAVVLLGLVAADAAAALHGAPLLLLVTCGAVQIGRELAQALASRRLYPATPVMNLVMGIITIHAAYFRAGADSVLLELLGCCFLAMYVLVVVAAFLTSLKEHGLVLALRDAALAHLLCVGIGGGLSCAFGIQVVGRSGPDSAGSELLALVLAGAWLAAALELRWQPRRPAEGPLRPGPAGELGGAAACVALIVGGTAALKPLAGLTPAHAAVLGLVVALSGIVGRRLVRALAAKLGLSTFRWLLPRQIGFAQKYYDTTCSGGLTDYAGWLALVLPIAYAYLASVVT